MPVPAPTTDPRLAAAVTVRRARSEDAPAIADLAALDADRPPTGTVLIAEVGGDLWAAVSLDDFHAVADPFRPSADVLALLLERARQLRGRGDGGARRRTRRRPLAAHRRLAPR